MNNPAESDRYSRNEVGGVMGGSTHVLGVWRAQPEAMLDYDLAKVIQADRRQRSAQQELAYRTSQSSPAPRWPFALPINLPRHPGDQIRAALTLLVLRRGRATG